MIKKYIKKAVVEYLREQLQPEINKQAVFRMEQAIAEEKSLREMKRHNALVEGWLTAFMKAQGVELPVEKSE